MFGGMGFEQAVSYSQTLSVVMYLVWFSIPVVAAVAIRRGKRNRPGTWLVFPRSIFWGWVLLLICAIGYFFTGAWYGENGPSPQAVAAQVTVALVVSITITAAIYAGLYLATQPRHGDRSDTA